MIKVLYIRIPEHVEQENLFVCLQNFVSGECYNEVLGYKNGKAALRRLLGEALVGFALREYWNLPLGTYRIARGEKGKPFIVGREDVFFNLSHSGEYVVCAVSDREIGVDIEKRAKARMEVAGRFFHEREVRVLTSLHGIKQDQLFFNYWSVKESYLKYTGMGLTRPLNSFFAMFVGERVSLYEGEKELPVYVNSCPVDAGYACYVCGEYDGLSGIREVAFEEITCC